MNLNDLSVMLTATGVIVGCFLLNTNLFIGALMMISTIAARYLFEWVY